MIWYAILWVVMTMGITVMLCGRLIAARLCPEDNERSENLGKKISGIAHIVTYLAFAGVGVMTISTSVADTLLFPQRDNQSINRWFDISLAVSLAAALGLRYSLYGSRRRQASRSYKLLHQNPDFTSNKSDNFHSDEGYQSSEQSPATPKKMIFYSSLSILILSQIAMTVLALLSHS